MAALLAGHGVEVTSQELMDLGRALPPPDEELGEDDLEEVAGGGISDVLKKIKDFFVNLFED